MRNIVVCDIAGYLGTCYFENVAEYTLKVMREHKIKCAEVTFKEFAFHRGFGREHFGDQSRYYLHRQWSTLYVV